jgi:hypothetical protein
MMETQQLATSQQPAANSDKAIPFAAPSPSVGRDGVGGR